MFLDHDQFSYYFFVIVVPYDDAIIHNITIVYSLSSSGSKGANYDEHPSQLRTFNTVSYDTLLPTLRRLWVEC